MELTKRQVRALVLAGSLDRQDFESAFEREAIDGYSIKIEGSREKPRLVIVYRGCYIAEVDPIARRAYPKDPLDVEVILEDGWLRVYGFADEEAR